MFVEAQLISLLLFNFFVIKSIPNKRFQFLINFILTLFFLLEFISYYLTNELIDYRFFIHFDLTLIKTYIFQFKYHLILLLLIFAAIKFFNYKIQINFLKKKYIYSLIIFFLLILVLPNKGVFQRIDEIRIIYNKNLFFSENYTKTSSKQQINKFIKDNGLGDYFKEDLYANKNFNIIFLTLESVDASVILDNPKLTPNLNKLINEWNFLKVEPSEGCNWSVGSFYCLMTGLPSFFPFEVNRIFHGSEKIKIINMGEILKKAEFNFLGYFVGESMFTGLKDLLKVFKFEVFDYKNKTGDFEVFPDSFGYHDRDLFFELKSKIKKLNKNNETFSIFASTINTHLNGIKDSRMDQVINYKADNNMQHAIKSLDFHIGDFVKFLKNENLLSNTAIFIAPDHLFPSNKSLQNLINHKKNSDNSLYLISNKKFVTEKNKVFQLELPKIVLDTSGIFHNHRFFYEGFNQKDLRKFVNDNKSNISHFNKSILKYKKKPKKINFKIKNNKFFITSDNDVLNSFKLKNLTPSYINLNFDENFLYKYDDLSETLIPNRIIEEDEKFDYFHIQIFKDKNKFIKAKVINTKNKNIFDIKNIKEKEITFDVQNYFNNNDINIISKDINRFIAHAGGEVDNHKYLNSLEGLNYYYDKGFKYFELDLSFTSDKYLVATHDWDTWKKYTNFEGKVPPTLNEFRKYKLLNKYTSLDYLKITQWFSEHKDAILVTDKVNNPGIFYEQIPLNKSNLIMELFSLEALKQAKEMGINVIVDINILRKINKPIDYMNKNKFRYVSIPQISKKILKDNYKNKIKNLFSKSLEKELLENNIKFFVYGLNDSNNISEIDIICNYSHIFYGMYADKWDFDKIVECN